MLNRAVQHLLDRTPSEFSDAQCGRFDDPSS